MQKEGRMLKVLIANFINWYLLLLQIHSGVLNNEFNNNMLFSTKSETSVNFSKTEVAIL